MTDRPSELLLRQFREGDSRAASEIVDRYVVRLIALARRKLSPKLRRRLDPEDIVQSAYRSFFLHADSGEYVLRRSGDLWRLLAAVTLHKLYGQVERHTAQRRDVGRETDVGGAVGSETPAAAASREPSPAEVAAAIEQLHLAMQQLSSTQREVLRMRLQGQTTEEIAAAIHRSERTVRRCLETARQRLEHDLRSD